MVKVVEVAEVAVVIVGSKGREKGCDNIIIVIVIRIAGYRT